MKNIFISIFVSSLILLGTGCKKEHPVEGEYLIFGSFYGECGGEQCIEIYKLEEGKLYEDLNDNYPSSQNYYNADFTQLNNSKYLIAKSLWDDFPQELFNETDTVIGMPDAGDWGGYYIEYNANGSHRYWLVDQVGSNLVPAYLNEYTTKVRDKIELIQN